MVVVVAWQACATRLFCLLLAVCRGVWVEPLIFVKENASLAGDAGRLATCQVLFIRSDEDAILPSGESLDINRFDAVFTDAHDFVPWTTARPPFHYIDIGAYPAVAQQDLVQQKLQHRSLSALVPLSPTHEIIAHWIAEARAVMPGDVYLDDGTAASRRPAFERYAYSILLSVEHKTASAALFECVAFGTVPLLVWTFDHFVEYTALFPFAIAKFRPEQFSPAFAKEFIGTAPSDYIHVTQNYLMLTQDFFNLRYSLPFSARLRLHAARLCEDALLPPTLKVHVFVAILSAKKNFANRQAARDSWLQLLANPISGVRNVGEPEESISVAYRFFTNAVSGWDAGEAGSTSIDDLVRVELEKLGDVVILDAVEEYPIGNMGRLALHWIANHTSAPYILKLDDDMYIRPLPLLRNLVQQQRAMMYWGFFERSGEVVRDPSLAHFLPADLFDHDGVFPPYARGAALAFSLDLVRLIAHFDRQGALRRLPVEDASYGYFLYQLVLAGVTSLTLVDNDEKHFSLDPKCCTEQTHPGNCWSPLSEISWLVHHVNPEAMQCMFQADIAAGYYAMEALTAASPTQQRVCSFIDTLHVAFAAATRGVAGGMKGDAPGTKNSCAAPNAGKVVPAVDARSRYDPRSEVPLPSLCHCVYSEPSHPGQPHSGPAPAPKRGATT